MKILKQVSIALLIVVFVICSVFDFWWLYVLIFEPDKEVLNTFYVGTITTNPSDEEEQPKTEYVIKVKYFSNYNKNGLECLDIQFSGFVDEMEEQIYSWGIQFVAENENQSLSDWVYNVDKSSLSGTTQSKWTFPLTWKYYHNIWGSYTPKNGNIHYYKSSDSFTYDITGATSLGNGEGFLISIDDDIYKLNFNYNVVNDASENSNFVAEKIVDWWSVSVYRNVTVYDYYYSYDIYDFAYMMYQQIQAVSNGKHSASLINLPDMFSYQIYDGKSYKTVSESENAKVSSTVRNFYSVYIEKSADGVQNATNSLFGCVNGTPQFNLTEEDDSTILDNGDYFIGNSVVDCDIYDFDFVNVRDNAYVLKLSQNFVNLYGKYSSKIKLSIVIDLDELDKKNIDFCGFSKDSGLSKFTILSCKTTHTVDGEIIKTEVDYA
jgi:hypothetical protein